MSLTAKLQIKQGQTVSLINPPSGVDLDVPTVEDSQDTGLLFVRNRDELDALVFPRRPGGSAGLARLPEGWTAWDRSEPRHPVGAHETARRPAGETGQS
jgi:hypothetical protein